MKTVTVLGAGQTAPFLIQYLLAQAESKNLSIRVADRDLDAATAQVGDHAQGSSIALDITDAGQRQEVIASSDLVINLMPPTFQPAIASTCIEVGTPMVSASYMSPEVAALSARAKSQGVLILCEMGLDPGIDLMTASEILGRVHSEGGEVESFLSYGSGLPEPKVETNPLRYCITWNPRNVVMSADQGAEYLQQGRIKISPWHQIFGASWPVEVPGYGRFDAYPNRDSLSYRKILGIESAHTLIRGTLRYPGWCQVWHQIVRLGMPDENTIVPGLDTLTMGDLLEMFLPPCQGAASRKERAAEFLGLGVDTEEIQNMDWLGLFSDRAIESGASTPAAALVGLLRQRLPLPPKVRDMVLLHHVIDVFYPESGGRERILSTFTDFGQLGGHTAMSRTVGLPAATGALLILQGAMPTSGCRIPTEAAVYKPVLAALRAAGLEFHQEVRPFPMESPATR